MSYITEESTQLPSEGADLSRLIEAASSSGAVVLTVNGRAALVAFSPEALKALEGRLDRAEFLLGLAESEKDFAAGRVVSADEMIANARKMIAERA